MNYCRNHALLLVATTILVLAGCVNTREGLKKDGRETAERAKEQGRELKEDMKAGAEKVTEATSDAVDQAKEEAGKAAAATSVAIDEAGDQASAAGRTLAVKTALMADKGVNATHINVDSDASTKVVRLHGSVTTEAEKALAAQIAHDKAGGWTVSNELTVKSM